MGKYDVDMKRLAVLLLPTALRQPRLTALAQVLMAPLSRLHREFTDYREAKDYRLTHNGQVCHLRAVLNDRFDPALRRIMITEFDSGRQTILLHRRSQENAIIVARRTEQGEAQRVIYRRNYGGIAATDFWIKIPNELRYDSAYNEGSLQALTNQYKLAGKRYGIIYY